MRLKVFTIIISLCTLVFLGLIYGNRYFSANFGIASSQLILAAFIGPYLGGVVYTATGSYAITFCCSIPFGVIAILFALIMKKRLPKGSGTGRL